MKEKFDKNRLLWYTKRVYGVLTPILPETGGICMDIIWERYNEWLNNCDGEMHAELESMTPEAMKDAFYAELKFGTAGLRGKIGAGTDKLNVFTVARATQGLADYLKSTGGKKVAISYDSRIKSDLFAVVAAEVLVESGINVIIVSDMMPTPYMSYMIRYYKCDAGIMITASHNPKEYNGYKVSGSDGCQINDETAEKILACIDKYGYFGIKRFSFDQALRYGMIKYAGTDVKESYLREVWNCGITHEADGLSVTYSALNGTGIKLIPEIFDRLGVKCNKVETQCVKDGTFRTCPYPNPEKPEAMELAVRQAIERGSDLVIATDPDADRVGVAVIKNGKADLLSGNETGLLLTDYILKNKRKIKRPIVIKSIVTTRLTEKICASYGAELINVLTGFKYIGGKVTELEKKGEAERFVLGFEESYGYLPGSYVRDKDAMSASMLICEMAADYKRKGKTLRDALNGIYAIYGLEEEKLVSYRFEGAEGSRLISDIMVHFRSNLPTVIGGLAVKEKTDFLTDDTGLVRSNVLRFVLEKDAQIILRPSGTEPLMKAYLSVCGDKESNSAIIVAMSDWLEGEIGSVTGR